MAILRSQITGMNFHYVKYTFEYFLDSMVKHQFQNIEVWGGAPHFYLEDLTLVDIRRVKQAIDSRGLKVVCFTPEQCMYPINIAAKEERMRNRSILYFKKAMDVAVEIGAPMVLVTVGSGYYNEMPSGAWNRAVDALHELVAYAEKVGVMLALEPLQRCESDVIHRVSTLSLMIQTVNSPMLKGMLDTVATASVGDELESYFEVLGDDLVHMHFIDGNPTGHLVWGDGNLPLERYLEILKRYDYQGALTLEIGGSRYFVDPDMATKRSLKQLDRYLID